MEDKLHKVVFMLCLSIILSKLSKTLIQLIPGMQTSEKADREGTSWLLH